jgi:hypothetical protein
MLLRHRGRYAAMVARQGGSPVAPIPGISTRPLPIELPVGGRHGRHSVDSQERPMPFHHVGRWNGPRHLREEGPVVDAGPARLRSIAPPDRPITRPLAG